MNTLMSQSQEGFPHRKWLSALLRASARTRRDRTGARKRRMTKREENRERPGLRESSGLCLAVVFPLMSLWGFSIYLLLLFILTIYSKMHWVFMLHHKLVLETKDARD